MVGAGVCACPSENGPAVAAGGGARAPGPSHHHTGMPTNKKRMQKQMRKQLERPRGQAAGPADEEAGLAPEVDACAPDPPLVLAAPAAAEGACGPDCWARHARSMLRSAASCDPSGKLV